jgi:hypothetical protein
MKEEFGDAVDSRVCHGERGLLVISPFTESIVAICSFEMRRSSQDAERKLRIAGFAFGGALPRLR